MFCCLTVVCSLFQWLTSVVNLQTSIARHLALRQLHPEWDGVGSGDGGRDRAGEAEQHPPPPGKPTASVPPRPHQHQRDVTGESPLRPGESPMHVDDDDEDVTCSNNHVSVSDDVTDEDLLPDVVLSSNNNKQSPLEDMDTTETIGDVSNNNKTSGDVTANHSDAWLNGGTAHVPDSLPNGPAASKPNGPISVLSGASSPTTLYPAVSPSSGDLLTRADLSLGKPAALATDASLGNKGRVATDSVALMTAPPSSSSNNRNTARSPVNKQPGPAPGTGTRVVTATAHAAGKVRRNTWGTRGFVLKPGLSRPQKIPVSDPGWCVTHCTMGCRAQTRCGEQSGQPESRVMLS